LITRLGIEGDLPEMREGVRFSRVRGVIVSSKKYSSRRSLFSLAKDKQNN
jgi:hypothetical protein